MAYWKKYLCTYRFFFFVPTLVIFGLTWLRFKMRCSVTHEMCFQTPRPQVTIVDTAWLPWRQVLKARRCEEGHCQDAEPNRAERAASGTEGTEARQGRSQVTVGLNRVEWFSCPLVLPVKCISGALRRLWSAPPSTAQEGHTASEGQWAWTTGSATRPLPSLRFPIHRCSRSVLEHRIHCRRRGGEAAL